VVLALSFIWIGVAEAATASLTVKAGEEVTHSVDLSVDDHVAIKFAVVGQASNTIEFSLTFPNSTVKNFGEVGVFSYGFVCDAAGECMLRFVNSDSVDSKLVTLNYEVEHYTFGMPQLFLYVLVIGGLCLVAVAVYIFMGKSS
jgi:hypothetical protein